MIEDQLTRNERIRLEALAQAISNHQMKPLPFRDLLVEAELFETWIKKADQNG